MTEEANSAISYSLMFQRAVDELGSLEQREHSCLARIKDAQLEMEEIAVKRRSALHTRKFALEQIEKIIA